MSHLGFTARQGLCWFWFDSLDNLYWPKPNDFSAVFAESQLKASELGFVFAALQPGRKIHEWYWQYYCWCPFSCSTVLTFFVVVVSLLHSATDYFTSSFIASEVPRLPRWRMDGWLEDARILLRDGNFHLLFSVLALFGLRVEPLF